MTLIAYHGREADKSEILVQLAADFHRLAACQAYQMTTPSPVPTNTHPAQQATDMSRAITCA